MALPAFGALTALYVATPAIAEDGSRGVVVGLAMASGILLLAGYQHISGVKVSGADGRGTVTLGLCAVLALLSASFGLAAADLRWWISAPAAVSFRLVLIAGRRFDRRYRERLGRGH